MSLIVRRWPNMRSRARRPPALRKLRKLADGEYEATGTGARSKEPCMRFASFWNRRQVVLRIDSFLGDKKPQFDVPGRRSAMPHRQL
jgi:hypothetical protein